ncbi:MAG: hypothetical protein WBJ13_03080 [Sedimentibacter sp.]
MEIIQNIDKYILGIEDTINEEECEEKNVKLIKPEDVKKIITPRKRDSHKGTYGKVGILSGSKGMAGDIGASNVGEYSLIASDIIKFLPAAFKSIGSL